MDAKELAALADEMDTHGLIADPAKRQLAAAALRAIPGLVEALEWYAEQTRLCRLIHGEGDAGRNALAGDGGTQARNALAPFTTPKGADNDSPHAP